MSKVLKFIVHLVVICTLICVLGLVLPPFFGVRTVIVDKSDSATNLPVGSVTYAIPEKSSEITVGTPILVEKDSKTYKYTITNIDASKGTGTVTDQSVSGDKTLTIKVGDYVPKVVITIGYVGYLLVATESIEGLIILGLVVLFLIILYVIAELWKKEPEDEYEDLQGDTRHVKTSKELKMEEKARARKMKEEDKELLYGEKEKKKRAKKEEKIKRKKIRTGGFVDEIYEDDLESEKHEQPKQPATVQTATSEAHELLKKEIAAATADEPMKAEEPEEQIKPEEIMSRGLVSGKTEMIVPQVKEQLRQMMTDSERQPVEASEDEEPEEIKRMVIPAWSAAQIAETAKKQGDAPDIVRDDVTKVTLFDYSDIIADEEPVQTEQSETEE